MSDVMFVISIHKFKEQFVKRGKKIQEEKQSTHIHGGYVQNIISSLISVLYMVLP